MDFQNFRQRVSGKARKVMRIALILILVVGIGLFSFYYWGIYDEGVRAGTVLRISKMGIVFKTYEGQLNLETFGALRGANPIAEAFDFSVEADNTQVIESLQEVALTGERVNLHYKKRYLIFPWRGDTKYFITRVERVGAAQEDK
ncbi:MAG TPA: hypothetical protein VKZ75_01130 [Cyclobacteriaceae bacterium]|nr:hypothetical protein [Cyclobacteriaceae bacterium]